MLLLRGRWRRGLSEGDFTATNADLDRFLLQEIEYIPLADVKIHCELPIAGGSRTRADGILLCCLEPCHSDDEVGNTDVIDQYRGHVGRANPVMPRSFSLRSRQIYLERQ